MKPYSVFVISFVLLVLVSNAAFAHNPPTCAQNDCGLIVGSVFYSAYYSPGNPNGTPVSGGGGTWIKTSNTSCGTYNYNGTNYTLYPHTFTCSLPLDSNSYMLIFGAGLLGFFQIRKRLNVSLIS